MILRSMTKTEAAGSAPQTQMLIADRDTSDDPFAVDGGPQRSLLRLSPRRRTGVVVAAKLAIQWVALAIGLALVALPAALCRLERWCTSRDELFLFWGQLFALAPGLPGKYLRRCFYALTVSRCSLSCEIGFLSYLADRRAEVGRNVYVGTGVVLGAATIGDGCQIANRVSIMNGGRQHRLTADGTLTACDASTLPSVTIGSHTWIGEGAIVMADVGSRSIIAAGCVVPRSVDDDCIVAGVPARVIGVNQPAAATATA
jgi:acetyltransferase-like isoleucine patch superfamily enzyme